MFKLRASKKGLPTHTSTHYADYSFFAMVSTFLPPTTRVDDNSNLANKVAALDFLLDNGFIHLTFSRAVTDEPLWDVSIKEARQRLMSLLEFKNELENLFTRTGQIQLDLLPHGYHNGGQIWGDITILGQQEDGHPRTTITYICLPALTSPRYANLVQESDLYIDPGLDLDIIVIDKPPRSKEEERVVVRSWLQTFWEKTIDSPFPQDSIILNN